MANDWTVTLRIDTSHWSANREYWVTNPVPGGMGHAWLTIASPSGHRVDIGYYPTGNAVLTPGTLLVGDVVHQAAQDAAYTFHVSADQAAKLLETATRIEASPGQYNVVNHNCLTVAHQLMTVAGIPVPALPESGMFSHAAWTTGTSSPMGGLHEPAAYNGILQSTSEGAAARALYDRSSELSGEHTYYDMTPVLHEAQAQASTYLGEVDDPNFLHPELSTPDHGGGAHDPGLSDPYDPNSSHDPGLSDAHGHDASPDPGMSTDHAPGVADHHDGGYSDYPHPHH